MVQNYLSNVSIDVESGFGASGCQFDVDTNWRLPESLSPYGPRSPSIESISGSRVDREGSWLSAIKMHSDPTLFQLYLSDRNHFLFMS